MFIAIKGFTEGQLWTEVVNSIEQIQCRCHSHHLHGLVIAMVLQRCWFSGMACLVMIGQAFTQLL